MRKEDLITCIPSLKEEEAEKLLELFEECLTEMEIEHETQLEEALRQAQKDELERKIISELEAAKPQSAEIVRRLLDEDKISLEDGKLCGLKEQLEALREEYGFLFCDEREKPKFTKGMRNKPENVDLSKMSYRQRLKLYEEMPELYKSLVK